MVYPDITKNSLMLTSNDEKKMDITTNAFDSGRIGKTHNIYMKTCILDIIKKQVESKVL